LSPTEPAAAGKCPAAEFSFFADRRAFGQSASFAELHARVFL